jgi:hypothetical protein
MIAHPLELCGGFFGLTCCEIRQSASIDGIRAAETSDEADTPKRGIVARRRLQRLNGRCRISAFATRRANVATSRLGSSIGERQPFGIINDLIEQLPDRLAILGDDRQLIAEGIGGRVKRRSILRVSTPEKTLLGPLNAPELRLEVSSKINEAQLQIRNAAISSPRTIWHISCHQEVDLWAPARQFHGATRCDVWA